MGYESAMLSNTCVAWILDDFHGTGHYEKGPEHVGIAILLSKYSETSWEKYRAAAADGTLRDEARLDWFDYI